jgi:hypothetical protein
VKVLRLLALGLLAQSSLVGCAGVAFSAHKTPLGFLYAETHSNELITDAKNSDKHGEACATSILGWFTTGDASAAAAAKAGGVSSIAFVDHSLVNYVGIFSKYCVQVYGS